MFVKLDPSRLHDTRVSDGTNRWSMLIACDTFIWKHLILYTARYVITYHILIIHQALQMCKCQKNFFQQNEI